MQLEYLNLGFSPRRWRSTPAFSEDRTPRRPRGRRSAKAPQTIVDHIIIVGNRRTSEDVIRREVLLRPGAPLGLQRSAREPAPAERARACSAASTSGSSSTAGRRGATCSSPSRKRRRRRSATAAVSKSTRRPARRRPTAATRRSASSWRRADSSTSAAAISAARTARSTCSRGSASGRRTRPTIRTQDGRGFGFSEYRVVGTYREPAALLWNADLLLTGAVEQGRAIELQLRAQGRDRRGAAPADAGPSASAAATRSARRGRSTSGSATRSRHRSTGCFRRSGCRRSPAPSPAIRATTWSSRRAARSSAAKRSVASRAARRAGRLRQDLPPGLLVQAAAGRARRRLRDPRARSASPTASARGASRPMPTAGRSRATDRDRGPAGERAVLRRRRHHHPRLRARHRRRARRRSARAAFPRGGNGVLILNAELRIPVWKDFGAALFVDGGNVFERVTQFDSRRAARQRRLRRPLPVADRPDPRRPRLQDGSAGVRRARDAHRAALQHRPGILMSSAPLRLARLR